MMDRSSEGSVARGKSPEYDWSQRDEVDEVRFLAPKQRRQAPYQSSRGQDFQGGTLEIERDDADTEGFEIPVSAARRRGEGDVGGAGEARSLD